MKILSKKSIFFVRLHLGEYIKYHEMKYEKRNNHVKFHIFQKYDKY